MGYSSGADDPLAISLGQRIVWLLVWCSGSATCSGQRIVCPFVRQLLGYLFADSRLTARSGQRRVLCVWRMAAWLLIHRRTATRSRQRLVCLSAHSEDGCLATQSVVSILLFLDSCSATPSMMAARILNWDSGLSAFSGDNCLAPRLVGGNLLLVGRMSSATRLEQQITPLRRQLVCSFGGGLLGHLFFVRQIGYFLGRCRIRYSLGAAAHIRVRGSGSSLLVQQWLLGYMCGGPRIAWHKG
jgi:hypothetical protein